MSSKFIDAHEAARWVASGDTVCTVGMTLIGAAESILSAIEARFLTAGEPRDLTLLHAAGQSDRQRGIQHFAHPGMVTRLIGSHWGLAPRWMAMINNNEVEAWCLPQGQIVHLYSAMAAGLPGRLSPVGLGTFVDPRIEGGRMNARTRERPNLIEHVTFRGDEYLFYPALPLDVVIVRGTHADEDGNPDNWDLINPKSPPEFISSGGPFCHKVELEGFEPSSKRGNHKLSTCLSLPKFFVQEQNQSHQFLPYPLKFHQKRKATSDYPRCNCTTEPECFGATASE